MEYIEVDSTTKQVLSSGSPNPMYGGEIIEVPSLPQREDPTINICDYYWDGEKFVSRPDGNIQENNRKEALLNSQPIKALIEILEEQVGGGESTIRESVKNKL